MSKEYPYLVLIKIIATFDYKNGLIMDKNGVVSVNQICKIIGTNYSSLIEIISILEKDNLCYIDERLGIKGLIINPKIIKVIEKAKQLRKRG